MQNKKPAKSAHVTFALEGNLSSGNVFADIGLPNAGELYEKAELVRLIGHQIRERKLTQSKAAAMMNLNQPDVSKLLRGRFAGFSLERLLLFIRALGNDIEIRVKPTGAGAQGRVLLRA
jgi:predicted XRE-type DNA-binding protein